MRLSPARHNRFLAKMGQAATWRVAHDCPCRTEHSGAAAYDCPACGGIGHLWDAAVATQVALTGLKQQRMWADFGAWISGDVVLSLASDQPIYAAGEFDRIVLTDSTQPFSTTRTHGLADTLDKSVSAISRVFWLDNAATVEGKAPAVAADGGLSWVSGEPPAGAQYTITGREHPQYFVYTDLPRDRAHHGGLSLPRLVVARSFNVFGRGV